MGDRPPGSRIHAAVRSAGVDPRRRDARARHRDVAGDLGRAARAGAAAADRRPPPSAREQREAARAEARERRAAANAAAKRKRSRAPAARAPATASAGAAARPSTATNTGSARATRCRRSPGARSARASRSTRCWSSLFRANPSAFSGNNMNRLKAGVVLVRAVGRSRPGRSRRPRRARPSPRRAPTSAPIASASPASTLETTPRAEPSKRQAAGKVQASVDDKKQPANASPDKLTLSKGGATPPSAPGSAEDRLASERERQAAAARVAELNKNVADLKKLQGAASQPSTATVATAPGRGAGPAVAAARPASPPPCRRRSRAAAPAARRVRRRPLPAVAVPPPRGRRGVRRRLATASVAGRRRPRRSSPPPATPPRRPVAARPASAVAARPPAPADHAGARAELHRLAHERQPALPRRSALSVLLARRLRRLSLHAALEEGQRRDLVPREPPAARLVLRRQRRPAHRHPRCRPAARRR